MFIAKSKIFVQTKRKGRKQYTHKNKYSGYLYLDVDENNSINMNLRITDKKNSIKVNIGKYAVFDMLMYHLSFRPIERPKNAEVYLNERVRAFKPEMDFNKLNPDQVKVEYENAIENLRSVISQSSRDDHIRKAQRQLDNLLESEWKVKLFRDIWIAKNSKPKLKS